MSKNLLFIHRRSPTPKAFPAARHQARCYPLCLAYLVLSCRYTCKEKGFRPWTSTALFFAFFFVFVFFFLVALFLQSKICNPKSKILLALCIPAAMAFDAAFFKGEIARAFGAFDFEDGEFSAAVAAVSVSTVPAICRWRLFGRVAQATPGVRWRRQACPVRPGSPRPAGSPGGRTVPWPAGSEGGTWKARRPGS